MPLDGVLGLEPQAQHTQGVRERGLWLVTSDELREGGRDRGRAAALGGSAGPDTTTTPWDQTTSSSRSTLMMGGAIRIAGQSIRQQLRVLAESELEATAGDVEIEDGRMFVRGSPDRSLTVADAVLHSGRGNLLAFATNQSHGLLDPETGQGVVTPHFFQAAAGAEVEVDRETGTVRIVNLRTETWAGQTINPVLAELQCEGNMAFGVGQALFEEIVLDGGQIVNASLADYLLPSILDLGPDWSAGVSEQADGQGRIHGLGESASAAVPAAIGNAVANAIGVSLHELPLKPERILRAIQQGEGAGSTEARQDHAGRRA